MDMYSGQTFEVEAMGFTFRARIEADCGMGEPWKEHDGHGVVSDWTTRDKRPGEIVLASERRSRRYYNVQETMKLARRDGWGLGDDDKASLLERLRRTRVAQPGAGGRYILQELPGPWKPLTRAEITVEAVRRDFEQLRRWCDDQWHWVGLVVELLDADGDAVDGVSDSLWGMESDADDCLRETAREMAGGLAQGLVREAAECLYWNQRDVETV
jgi:hypothetical protein